MKRIIDGKLYDSEKARAVKSTGHGDGQHQYTETLYRKRTGEYFLCGSGEQMTHYLGTEKIIPLSYVQAQQWGKDEMTDDEYKAEFEAVTDDKRVFLGISLPADVADRIRKQAATEGISISECIRRKF